MNKDLKFLASILDETNWPEVATRVRLDVDGEVCFNGTVRYDFYPDDLNAAKDAFVPACFHTVVGEKYSLQDILDARDELGLNSGKVWRGSDDGLPPVGTECEISNCGNPFAWCHVKYMGDSLCVVDHKTHKDQHYHLSSVEFRPILSEEDKVVEEDVSMNKDLKFLASILDEENWPEDAPSVRLDIDGEVCFMGEASRYDFRPSDLDAAKDAFVPAPFQTSIGEEYSLQEILDARDTLEKRHNKKKTDTVDKVIDELDIRREVNEASVALGFRQWRGLEDWLPPVGQWVQFKRVDRAGEKFDGQECYVISNGRDEFGNDVTTVYFKLHGYQAFRSDCFRPIRSEEDRAVEEIVEVIINHYEYPKGAESYLQLAKSLYRAGYRKQENPE